MNENTEKVGIEVADLYPSAVRPDNCLANRLEGGLPNVRCNRDCFIGTFLWLLPDCMRLDSWPKPACNGNQFVDAVLRGRIGRGEARELSTEARHLVLHLPIGSKEGSYEVALLSGSDEQIRDTTGIAQLENHTTTLNADFDLAGVSPGSYFLGVRQPGLEWSRYPVRVK